MPADTSGALSRPGEEARFLLSSWVMSEPQFLGTMNDPNCPARRSARTHICRILRSRARTARDRAAGMALEDGGRKEMLF
jgi:hypothetical protein